MNIKPPSAPSSAPAAFRLRDCITSRTCCALAALALTAPGTAQCPTPLNASTPTGFVPDGYGFAIAASDARVVVGARTSTEPPVPSSESGAAYVFDRIGADWTQTTVLIANDGKGREFGWAIALLGGLCVVGSPGNSTDAGAAYVYRNAGGSTWVLEDVLVPSTPEPYERFGEAVAATQTHVFVTAARDDAAGSESGAVYVFEKQGSDWVQVQRVISSNTAGGDSFGAAIAAKGDTLVVGSPMEGGPLNGAVYVFENVGGHWTEAIRIAGPKGRFGRSVDIHAGIMVAATNTNVRVYEDLGGLWIATAKLDPTINIGDSVATRNGLILVGFTGGSAGGGIIYTKQLGWWFQTATIFGDPNSGTVGNSCSLAGSGAVLGGFGSTCDLYEKPANGWLSYDVRFRACPPELSLFTGGAQFLEVIAGAQYAGQAYLIVGSATGTDQGIPVGNGLSLPLNWDAYTDYTLSSVNNPPMVNTFAPLDTAGSGEARFELPASTDPGLTGVVLHHAYAVFDVQTLDMKFVSNAAPLRLTP